VLHVLASPGTWGTVIALIESAILSSCKEDIDPTSLMLLLLSSGLKLPCPSVLRDAASSSSYDL
jgi:hypothetical protein